jgi:TRAP transporter TAXI family solute receptor
MPEGVETPAVHDRTRRRFLRSALASAVGVAAGRAFAAPLRNVYRWGSSSLGSSGYVIMEAFAQTANRHTAYRNSSLATAGTGENMYLIGEGKLEFAHSTSVDWTTALKGESPYKRPVRSNQLFAYAVWQQLPIVRADSGIRELSDLAGLRFSPSLPGSGTAAMYKVIMEAANLDGRMRWRYGSWSEVYTAFRADQIDAVVGVLTNGRRSSGIQQLESTMEIRAVTVPVPVLARARNRNPGILEDRLGPDQWAILGDDVPVPAMTGIVASSPDVTPEVGYEVTRAILDRAAEVRKLGSPLSGLDLKSAVRNLLPEAPVNAGAAQYFMEQGVWRNDLTIAA